jgi:hypothetical protein
VAEAGIDLAAALVDDHPLAAGGEQLPLALIDALEDVVEDVVDADPADRLRHRGLRVGIGVDPHIRPLERIRVRRRPAAQVQAGLRQPGGEELGRRQRRLQRGGAGRLDDRQQHEPGQHEPGLALLVVGLQLEGPGEAGQELPGLGAGPLGAAHVDPQEGVDVQRAELMLGEEAGGCRQQLPAAAEEVQVGSPVEQGQNRG